MDELVIGEKRYVSSKKAAEITGYAKDYVGQLCREGYVEAKMVGRSWYVLETSIQEHRFGSTASNAANTAKISAEREESISNSAPIEVHTPKQAPTSPVLAWERPTYVPEEPMTMPAIEARSEPATAAQGHSGAFLNEDESAIDNDIDQNTVESDSNDGADALTDMQAAWKEWFEQKRSVIEDDTEIEEPAGSAETDSEMNNVDDVSENVEEYSYVGKTSSYRDDDTSANDSGETVEIPIQRQKVAPELDESDANEAYAGDSKDQEAREKAIQIPLRRMRAQEQGIIHEERFVHPSKVSKNARRTARKERRSTAPSSSLLSKTILVAIAGIVIAVAVVGSGLASTGSNPVVDFLGGTSTINKQ